MASEDLVVNITSKGGKQTEADILGLGKAADTASGKVDGLNDSLDKTSKTGGALTKVLTGLVAAVSVGELIKASDAYTQIQNKLASVTDNAKQTTEAYQALKKISLDTGTAIDGNAKIFQSLASVAKQYNLSGKDVAKVTEGIAKTLKATGASGPGAAAALFQLSQSLGSGTLRGEEFNSVIEGAPGLLDVLAKQLNTTRGGLRALANDGKITTKQITDAFINNFDAINKAAASVPLTIGGAFQNLQTAFTDYIGSTAQATGASAALASVIGLLADNLNILVPIVLAVGAAFVAVQLVELAADFAAVTVKVYELGQALVLAVIANPVVAAITALVAVIAIVITKTVGWQAALEGVIAVGKIAGQVIWNTFALIANAAISVYNAILQVGQALHLIDQSRQPLQSLAYDTSDVSTKLDEAKDTATNLSTALGNTASGLTSVGSSANSAGSSVNGFKSDLSGLATQANATTTALKNLIDTQNRVAAAHGNEIGGFANSGSFGTGTQISSSSIGGGGTLISGGSISHFRDGGGFRVPGAGPVDSRLVQFMATPGERVSVTTPAQQQKGLPHFRDGGTLGITRGLSGIDVKTVLADDQSVTGYTANGTAGSNTADAKQSIINGMSIFKTGNPLQWARAISAADYLRGDPIATYQVGNQGQVGALKSGQDIIDLYKGPTPQDALAAGPFGFTTQTALTNASNAAQNFADLTKDIQSHLDDIATRRARFSAIQTRDHWKRHPDINLTDDDRKYLALGKQYHLTGKAGPYTLPGITGFSFRDGGSIRVPGAGPVDSQYVGMHVSPGEEISVKTRQQQDAERRAGAGGRPVNIVVNIQANDADSFNRSKAQTLRDFADQVGQAYNGG